MASTCSVDPLDSRDGDDGIASPWSTVRLSPFRWERNSVSPLLVRFPIFLISCRALDDSDAADASLILVLPKEGFVDGGVKVASLTL